jgi:hypothetical protein
MGLVLLLILSSVLPAAAQESERAVMLASFPVPMAPRMARIDT